MQTIAESTENIHPGSIKIDLQEMKHAQSFYVEKYLSFPSFIWSNSHFILVIFQLCCSF